MNPARIAIIVVAGVAAIALALFVRNLAAPPKSAPSPAQIAQAPPMSRVLVAKRELAIGERLSADNMTWQPWPAATLNVAFITDGVAAAAPTTGAVAAVGQAGKMMTDMATGGGPKMQAMIGDIVKEPIYAGEPITDHKVVRAGQSGYMAVRLPAGMRALSLPISADSAAGGFIQPGDRVDIMTTHPDSGKSGQMITEVVLQNVLVLAIDQHTDSPKAGAALPGATITLEVPADSATIVARARTLGLTLALRSYADIGGQTHGLTEAHAVRLFKGGAPAQLVSAQ
jgi:pilus assembly protein CpaB